MHPKACGIVIHPDHHRCESLQVLREPHSLQRMVLIFLRRAHRVSFCSALGTCLCICGGSAGTQSLMSFNIGSTQCLQGLRIVMIQFLKGFNMVGTNSLECFKAGQMLVYQAETVMCQADICHAGRQGQVSHLRFMVAVMTTYVMSKVISNAKLPRHEPGGSF